MQVENSKSPRDGQRGPHGAASERGRVTSAKSEPQ